MRATTCSYILPEIAHSFDSAAQTQLTADDTRVLRMRATVRSSERRHIDGVADWLIARRVDHVAQGLLGVLDTASFWIAIAQEDQLLLLPRPQASNALAIYLTFAETQQ